jgi:hypothetical protein
MPCDSVSDENGYYECCNESVSTVIFNVLYNNGLFPLAEGSRLRFIGSGERSQIVKGIDDVGNLLYFGSSDY